ncbi:MAG TPA: hypothetical protein VF331_12800 [Polyangiales bacterium]
MDRVLDKTRAGWRHGWDTFHCAALIAAISCLSDSCGSSKAPAASMDGSTAACNAVVDDGPLVTMTAVASAAPSPVGGTIADGTYVLSAATLYTGPGGSTAASGGAFSGVFQIKGTTMLQVGTVSGKEERYVTTFTTSGTTLSTNDTCPVAKSETHSFSANPTGFTVYDATGNGTFEQAYTKR